FIIVMPIVVIAGVLTTVLGWPMDVLIGMLAIGGRSLKEHAFAVKEALFAGDLATARTCTSMLVSRDTRTLNEEGLSRATIESVLENASDAIFAPLFWFLMGGAPAVVLYRLANTLDAMWGYKNKRFLYFGRFSARVDDVLNYIPARLTAMTWLILGDYKSAKYCWETQANTWYSPNAGVVMAVGAGALRVTLGGNAIYEGEEKQRPVIGIGNVPVAEDIQRSWQLVFKGLVLWSIISVFLAWMF
ncbi:MAG TPA: cobalamin biosynthesis protein CobD, partial [Thiothrix sp.]|nr:cobalamin biosynthesis protein CobD [Thiothrix sp.]